MANFEPGPWEVRQARTLLHVVGDGPVCGISISANHVHEDKPGDKARFIERQHANARLIAAAPDLLALALDLEWSASDLKYGECCPLCRAAKLPVGQLDPFNGHTPMCALNAAIAKATGQ